METQELHRGRLLGAFVIDPDGNNIEVVFRGPAKTKSADSVKITFEG